MTSYSVSITVESPAPIDADLIDTLGAFPIIEHSDTKWTTLWMVDALDALEAVAVAAARTTEATHGAVVAVEVLTEADLDRQLAEPAFPELVGVAEVAEMLGVTRQRASALQTRSGFPTPVAVLRSGPVWRRGDLSTFAEEWTRQPGRPRRTAAVA